jgi:hypothetical protein
LSESRTVISLGEDGNSRSVVPKAGDQFFTENDDQDDKCQDSMRDFDMDHDNTIISEEQEIIDDHSIVAIITAFLGNVFPGHTAFEKKEKNFLKVRYLFLEPLFLVFLFHFYIASYYSTFLSIVFVFFHSSFLKDYCR